MKDQTIRLSLGMNTRHVEVNCIILPRNSASEGIRALLHSILFIRAQTKVHSRRVNEVGNLGYASVDNEETRTEVDHVINKLMSRLVSGENGLHGTIKVRFYASERNERHRLHELFSEESVGRDCIEVWTLPILISDEALPSYERRTLMETNVREALKYVYEAAQVIDHFSGTCTFTLSVTRGKARSGSDTSSDGDASFSSRRRRTSHSGRGMSSANGRSLLFKIFNSAGIL